MFKDLLRKLAKPGKRGFTLIEVVIVLAIAGLIFVIVFLAVQSAQRGRRDQERQSAAGRIVAAAESYAGNNNGTLPANCAAFSTYYNLGGLTCTNSGTVPSATATSNLEFSAPNFECSTATPPAFSAKQRVVAVRYWSESANNILCIDSD